MPCFNKLAGSCTSYALFTLDSFCCKVPCGSLLANDIDEAVRFAQSEVAKTFHHAETIRQYKNRYIVNTRNPDLVNPNVRMIMSRVEEHVAWQPTSRPLRRSPPCARCQERRQGSSTQGHAVTLCSPPLQSASAKHQLRLEAWRLQWCSTSSLPYMMFGRRDLRIEIRTCPSPMRSRRIHEHRTTHKIFRRTRSKFMLSIALSIPFTTDVILPVT